MPTCKSDNRGRRGGVMVSKRLVGSRNSQLARLHAFDVTRSNTKQPRSKYAARVKDMVWHAKLPSFLILVGNPASPTCLSQTTGCCNLSLTLTLILCPPLQISQHLTTALWSEAQTNANCSPLPLISFRLIRVWGPSLPPACPVACCTGTEQEHQER